VALGHPQLLVSAYDIYHSGERIQVEIRKLIEKATSHGAVVLLDSGNYESYWRRDSNWTFEKFISVLESMDSIPTFSFDVRRPDASCSEIVREIEAQARAEASTGHPVIPIIYADGKDIEEISWELVELISPKMVAIPERLLGDGIVQRAKTVARIRKKLNQRGRYIPLHLLGTGNPHSILLYVMCGADSFDGLEWCQTTVDHTTALLYHFQQRELFGAQNGFCEMTGLPYSQVTLAHNLLFYREWMAKIQNSMAEGRLLERAGRYYSSDFISEVDAYLDL
jgi:queuine/archaeosine tRNA-ribosyltransferase